MFTIWIYQNWSSERDQPELDALMRSIDQLKDYRTEEKT
jgi:hypothetical protein